jgi:hypothetical protein
VNKLRSTSLWIRSSKATLLAAVILTLITVVATVVLLLSPKPIQYDATGPLSAVVIVVLVGSCAVSGIVVIDRMFVAWYRNQAPDLWERLIWLIFLVAIPYGLLIYYWVVYRRLDARGQRAIFKHRLSA